MFNSGFKSTVLFLHVSLSENTPILGQLLENQQTKGTLIPYFFLPSRLNKVYCSMDNTPYYYAFESWTDIVPMIFNFDPITFGQFWILRPLFALYIVLSTMFEQAIYSFFSFLLKTDSENKRKKTVLCFPLSFFWLASLSFPVAFIDRW